MFLRNSRRIIPGVLCLSLGACIIVDNNDDDDDEPPVGGDPLTFGALGDMPYTPAQKTNLVQGVGPLLDAKPYPFIIHYGDSKGQFPTFPGDTDCTEASDDEFEDWIAARKAPVFYTPGDNEWTDCDLPALTVPVPELERLETIRTRFFSTPVDAPELAVVQQATQVENQSWVATAGDTTVVFGTVHVTGTRNGRDTIYDPNGADPTQVNPEPLATEVNMAVDERDMNNEQWLMEVFARAEDESADVVVIATQADPTGFSGPQCDSSDTSACDPFLDFKDTLATLAEDYGEPVLLLHGDTPDYCTEAEFLGVENLWRHNGPGDHTLTDVVDVTVTPGLDTPFEFTTVRFDLPPTECPTN
jgi:hypothetical protein